MDDKQIKIKPMQLAIISVIVTVSSSIMTDFGNFHCGGYAGLNGGVILIIGTLIIPVFVKEYRKEVWTKKSLIILFIALLINLPFDIISLINHYNL